MSSASSSNESSPRCHVHKFGGSSLDDAAQMRAIGGLLGDGAGMRLVVVSAMQGTTNALVALSSAARMAAGSASMRATCWSCIPAKWA